MSFGVSPVNYPDSDSERIQNGRARAGSVLRGTRQDGYGHSVLPVLWHFWSPFFAKYNTELNRPT